MNLKNIHSTLIFIIAATLTCGESQNNFNIPIDFRLSTTYMIPEHYNVKLIFLLDTEYYNGTILPIPMPDNNMFFHGESSIIISILHSTRNITLHVLNVHSSSWTLIKKDLIYIPERAVFKEKNLILYFNDILYPGLYNLKMSLLGHIADDNAEGFSRTSHQNKDRDSSWVIATYTQIGARRLFPCLDNPQIRTTFTISIKHPRKSTALSNMPTRKISIDDDDFKWTFFCTTPPLSTHHIAIAVTNYNRIRINKNTFLWCKICFRKDTFKFANQVIENVTSHLTSVFEGIVIPKIDHVAIPNCPQDGTSKWGLIFHREEDLIYDEDLDAIMRKVDIARFIAQKIAYQWFGNVVSPSRWSSFWLHDGLATIYGQEAIVKTFTNSIILDFVIVQNQYESLHLDSYYDMNPPRFNNVSEFVSLYNYPRYIKVPIVLRMLQNAITDEVFRSGVYKYLHTYIFNSVTIDDFWSIQDNMFKKSNYTIPKEFLNWILYRHYPVLKWTQISPTLGKLSQHFSTSRNYGKWWIPTTLITQISLHKNNINVWLTEEKPYFLINHSFEDWIMVDIQQAGYYRVNYEDENWLKIFSYYKQNLDLGTKNINVINCAKMIDDMFHFIIERQFNSSFASWNLPEFVRLENELETRDFVVWYPMLKMFEYMSNAIPLYENSSDNNVKGKIKLFVNYAFEKLRHVQYPSENDFIECLREEILKWSCMFRHEQCLAMAKEDLLYYLGEHPFIDTTLRRRNWVFCNGLLTANISVWGIVRNRWLKNNHDLLPYLACTQDSSIVLEYLPYILWNPSTNATQNTTIIRSYINIFHSIIAKHVNDYSILTEILAIFSRIKPKEISIIVALTDIINHVYSEKHLNALLTELNQYIKDTQQISKIQHKIQTRLSQIKNQIHYFQSIY